MKKTISLFLVFQISFIFLLSGCTSKPTSSTEILYDGKTLQLEMTKETIDNLLGESRFIKEQEILSDNIEYLCKIYQYKDIEVRYYKSDADENFWAKGYEWTTKKVKTFNNVNVGATAKQIEKQIDHYSLSKTSYTVDYYIVDGKIVTSGKTENRETQYNYYYNENGEIYKIGMSIGKIQ